jgi:hypothetical protein
MIVVFVEGKDLFMNVAVKIYLKDTAVAMMKC